MSTLRALSPSSPDLLPLRQPDTLSPPPTPTSSTDYSDQDPSITRPSIARPSRRHKSAAPVSLAPEEKNKQSPIRLLKPSKDAPPVSKSQSKPRTRHSVLSIDPRAAYPPQTTAALEPRDGDKDRKAAGAQPERSDRGRIFDGTSEAVPSRTSVAGKSKAMHNTSTQLLRMNEDERPFTREFQNLFATLIVSLPMTPHRVRFTKIDNTFTAEEALLNLGMIKFSQSNRMPDPRDLTRIVTTTTSTTFSMTREMAKLTLSQYLEARWIESPEGKMDFSSRSSVWQLTPKGMNILQTFCQRNGINQRHVYKLLDSPRNTMHLIVLERDPDTDKLNLDSATIGVIFRRFAGQDGPNVKDNASHSDSESLSDYSTGLVGVRMLRERKIFGKIFHGTFTGRSALLWLMDCCTTVDRREATDIASLFVQHELILCLAHDQAFVQAHGPSVFQPTKEAFFHMTEKGQRLAGWIQGPAEPLTNEDGVRNRDVTGRDSNTSRMHVVLRDPALRLLFKEYLRETHCVENLDFYFDDRDLLANFEKAKKASDPPRLEIIRELLASAYSTYNAFLAPGSPCELNIDHTLRNAFAGCMTRAIEPTAEAMLGSLEEIAKLFEQAQVSVFRLMASDSLPKFLRDPRYTSTLRTFDID